MTDSPVAHPLLTQLLVEAIHDRNVAAGERPKAFDTAFRHSDAGKCARALGMALWGFAKDPVVDLPGEYVMWLGEMIHLAWQDAVVAKFPTGSVTVEEKVRHGELSSGHADAVVVLENGKKLVYELKTMGGYGFNRAVGLDRKRYARTEPEGPSVTAKLQGALNAYAMDADLLVIGVVSLEAVSRQLAGRLQMPDLDRILSEWHYPPEAFVPWAEAELDRLAWIKSDVERLRYLPDRIAVDTNGTTTLNPKTSSPDWRCTYCAYRQQCITLGPGIVNMEGYENHEEEAV
jgi:hypothetical protein